MKNKTTTFRRSENSLSSPKNKINNDDIKDHFLLLRGIVLLLHFSFFFSRDEVEENIETLKKKKKNSFQRGKKLSAWLQSMYELFARIWVKCNQKLLEKSPWGLQCFWRPSFP